MLNTLFFVGIALVYAILKIYLEKRLAPLDAVGDDRRMADLAFASRCSVYDLFVSAGSKWSFSRGKIDEDFHRYLKRGEIPPYVHDYVQRHLQAEDHTYQQLIFSGGRPPYL